LQYPEAIKIPTRDEKLQAMAMAVENLDDTAKLSINIFDGFLFMGPLDRPSEPQLRFFDL